MTIQIISSDEKTIENLDSARIIHRDASKVIMLAVDVSNAVDSLLASDGLFIGTHDELIETKSQFIQTYHCNECLKSGQILVEFEL